MRLKLDPSILADYRTFLAVKRLPRYQVIGESVEFPDEYAEMIGVKSRAPAVVDYTPSAFLFDYQRDIVTLALRKQRFAVFADCGLGKTLIYLEWIRGVLMAIPSSKCILIVAPLMVVRQSLEDVKQFYGDSLPIEQVRAANMQDWLNGDRKCHVGITNYEAISEGLTPGDLAALVLDESSTLKSHYGAWGTRLIDLGSGLEWKLYSIGEVSRNDWIDWAECCWSDIRETDTLNIRGTKSEDDTRHICPLQLEVIRRLVLLYSNPGELVFSPFTGIGSEGYVALKHGRKFYGCELKPEYHSQACRNLDKALRERRESQRTLFDLAASASDSDVSDSYATCED